MPKPVRDGDRDGDGGRRRGAARRLAVLVGRILIVFAALAAIGAVLFVAWRRPEPVWSGLAPVVMTTGLLLVVHHGYLAARELRWRNRQRVERREQELLDVPVDVPRPRDFPGVAVIDDEQRRVLATVPDSQGRMYARGVKIAILPALAVLVAALPTLRPDNDVWAIGAAVAEFAALVVVLYVVRASGNPSGPWVQSRTRAELLRREQYLRLAQVGPYLNLTEERAQEVTAQRLSELSQASATPPTALLPMRDAGRGRRWIDLLWTSPHQPLPDLRERARSYLHYRIDRQRMWFRLGLADTKGTERRISHIIWVALIAAVVIVTGQVVLRLVGAGVYPYPAIATLLALALPPFAAFLIAIRELYAYRGRAASYAQVLVELTGERQVLESLIARIEDPAQDQAADPRSLGSEFQAFVLHLESTLTVELQTWIMLTDREQFEIDV